MEKIRLQPVGHQFDASVLATQTGTFGGGFATGHRRPQWIYRYDAEQVEVRTMSRLSEHVFGRITAAQLAGDSADELEIEYVCSATICDLDVLLICTADRFSNESRLYVYDPCLGRRKQLPLPEGRSITCAVVSAPFQLQVFDDESEEDSWHVTTQLLLLGTGTSEMYINRFLLSDDPFGIEPLIEASQYKRLPESHSGPITSIAYWADPANVAVPSNTICIAWGTDRGKVLLVEYHFNQRITGGVGSEDKFYYIEAVEIADHGRIAHIAIEPITNDDMTINEDDNSEDNARSWYCVVAQNGLQTRGKPSTAPLVSVCRTTPRLKQWAAVGHVTPFADTNRSGIYGRTLTMSLVKKQNELVLYSVYYAKYDSITEGSTRLVVTLLNSNGEGVKQHVKRYNLSNLDSDHFMIIYPITTSEECFILCSDQLVSMPASPVFPIEDEDDEEGVIAKQKQEQIEVDSAQALALFTIFPYTTKKNKQIAITRKRFNSQLFIDRLLAVAGLEVGELYPPTSESQLAKLILAIYESGLDQIKKDSMIFYLVRDCQDDDITKHFLQNYSIPLPYQQAITGYWLLDQENYKQSVDWLCMPTVMVDWSDDILAILCQSQLYVLASQFIEMRQWKPTSSKGIQLLFDTLLHTNMPQALLVQRQYNGHEINEHGQLFAQLLDYCFNGENMKIKLNHLMQASLTKGEETQLMEYCEDFEAPYRLDFLIMYHVHHVHYVEAIQLNERARQREDPRRATGKQAVRRNAIIEDLRSLLPRVQRNAMEVGITVSQSLGQSVPNQHFPLVAPLLLSTAKTSQLAQSAMAATSTSTATTTAATTMAATITSNQTPSVSHTAGFLPLSASKQINQIEGQTAEEREISLLRAMALQQAQQQSPHLKWDQLVEKEQSPSLQQQQQQQQQQQSQAALTSSNLRLSPATKSDTTTATTFTRTHPNTSAPQSSSQMQSPDWAKRIDTSTAQANTSHENDERYTGDTAVSNSYNRRKSTPLPPLPRNSPFPPCVQPSPSLAHQDASHGSPRPTNVANKQPRTSQRRRKATATTASSSSGAAAAAISSPIKHQLIMSDDDHEMTGAMMETPTRRPRTVRAKQASPAVTRSTRRRAAMKQRNDTDDIMSRTPGAFTTEKAPVTPAKSSRSRAYSPRKKTKTTTEQRDSISSSRRSTRARNPQTDDETMSMDASHKDVPAQLIRNGDTPWPSRVQSHTRLRGNNSSSNTGHDKFNLTKKELVSLSSMHGTPSATSTKTGTRRGHAKDAATSTDNTGNVMTESYYTPSKKPVSAMKIASSTAIDDTPRQQARMLTRSMRRAHANESETGE